MKIFGDGQEGDIFRLEIKIADMPPFPLPLEPIRGASVVAGEFNERCNAPDGTVVPISLTSCSVDNFLQCFSVRRFRIGVKNRRVSRGNGVI